MSDQETKASKTKGITTLFIASALLVGFMGISQSLSQTATAQSFESCPPGTVAFERGRCIGPEPTVTTTCPEGQHLNENQNKCVGGGQRPSQPTTTVTCPEPFELRGGQCVAKPGST